MTIVISGVGKGNRVYRVEPLSNLPTASPMPKLCLCVNQSAAPP